MPWKPSTDFEEEIVNLQPDHDFIFGALSEPAPLPFYPRPKSHIEYAATKKRLMQKQQDEYELTGKFNDRLHVISQVHRIAGTKPLGEQPTVNDWDNDKDAEKEVVAMMRHFGLGPSVEEPLNAKVTIATYPVKGGVQVMQNGRKKMPLLFDDNLFKLKPKASNSSTPSFESESNNSLTNADEDKMLSYNERDHSGDTSLNNSSSTCDINSNSFHTGDNLDDSNTSNASASSFRKAQIDRHTLLLQAERMHQYGKLHEEEDDNDAANRFSQQSFCYDQDSFKTALNDSVISTCEEGSTKTYLNTRAREFIPSSIGHCSHSKHNTDNKNRITNNQTLDECCDDSFTRFNDNSFSKSSSFLQRFIKSDTFNDSGTSTGSSLASTSLSSSPILQPPVPPTYANIARKSFKSLSPVAVDQVWKSTPKPATPKSTLIQPAHLKFVTAREVYERKRHAL